MTSHDQPQTNIIVLTRRTGSWALEPWETWGVAARWNPQHHWHHPDEEPTT
jgi:hypothetical protein